VPVLDVHSATEATISRPKVTHMTDWFYLRYVIKIPYLMRLILQSHLLKPRQPTHGPSIRPSKTGDVFSSRLDGLCVVAARNDVTIKNTVTVVWQNHKYLSSNGPDLWRS